MTVTEVPTSILNLLTNNHFGHDCNVEARGTLRVLLTMNVGSSLFPDGLVDSTGASMYDTFRRIRGTDEFVMAVRNLPSRIIKENGPLILDTETVRIEKVGYQMGVLSQYLRDYEFTPIYILNPDLAINPVPEVKFDEESESQLKELGIRDAIVAVANARLAEEWTKWPVKKVMLSRYGVFQVILERPLSYNPSVGVDELHNPDETVPLTNVLDLVLGLDQNFDVQTLLDQAVLNVSKQQTQTSLLAALRRAEQLIENTGTIRSMLESSIDPSVQWEVVREIRSRFLNAFGRELTINETDGEGEHPIVLSFTGSDKVVPAFTRGVSYNLRFRYVIFDFDRLKYEGKVVQEPTLSPEVQNELASLLEAVLLTRTPGRQKTPNRACLANIKKRHVETLFEKDVSTWDWEQCLFSTDNALICHYYPTISPHGGEIALKLPFSQEVLYSDYWASIVRGIAYLAELHTVAEYLELDTSDDLEDTSRLMLKVHLGSLRSVQPTMTNIINKVAHSSRLVARLRNASMSTTMATADYALIKYKELYRVFEMETTLHHSDRNINLINSHLAHYDDVLMQSDIRRSSILTIVLTVALIFLTTALAWFSFPTFIGEITKPGSESAALINKYMSWFILNPASVFARIGGVILILMTFATVVAFIVAGYSISNLNSHRLHITRNARPKK